MTPDTLANKEDAYIAHMRSLRTELKGAQKTLHAAVHLLLPKLDESAYDLYRAMRNERDELVRQLRLVCDSDNDSIVRAGYINAARDLLAKHAKEKA